MSATLPPTPTLRTTPPQSTTSLPLSPDSITPTTVPIPTSSPSAVPTVPTFPTNPSAVPTGQVNGSSTTLLSIASTSGPSSAPNPTFSPPTFGPPTSGPSTFSGIIVTSTVAKGIFGYGTNVDPLIIFAIVVAGLFLLFLLGALIYCCCYYCGATTRPVPTVIRRTGSFQSIRQERLPSRRPIYLTTSLPQEYGYSAPARYVAAKRYLYPTDVMGLGNDVTYNTIRPTVVTTLGDGYALGHSLRSVGNRYGSRNSLRYEDEYSPKIITLY